MSDIIFYLLVCIYQPHVVPAHSNIKEFDLQAFIGPLIFITIQVTTNSVI